MDNKNVFVAIALSMSVLLFWGAFFESPKKDAQNLKTNKMITVSERAANQVNTLMTTEGLDKDYFIRVSVVGGGCSGLSYKMDFDNESQENDQVFESNGYKVVCDMKSFLYLCGTELDFTDGLNGKGFQFNNPNANRTCGCGESFSV